MGWYHDPSFQFENDAAASSSTPADTTIDTDTTTDTDTTSATPSGETACPLPPGGSPPPPPPAVEHIYHLAQKSKWQMSKAKKEPYFPPTYMKDGKFTRATVHKSDLVTTANEFYKDSTKSDVDFIVLELNCSILYSLGIPIMAQDAPESTEKKVVRCLQVFGGISTTLPGLVHKIYGMKRDTDGTFLELVKPAAPKNKANGDGGCCASGTCPPKEKKSAAPPEQAKKTKTAAPPPVKEKKKGWFSRKSKA
jgi:hypothetical protein